VTAARAARNQGASFRRFRAKPILLICLVAKRQTVAVPSRKIIFTTFGGGTQHFHNHAALLGEEAQRTGWFSDVRVWTDQSFYGPIFAKAPSAGLRSLGMADVLDCQFALRNRRGFGYWIWKPAVIERMLRQTDDGDLIVYADAGTEISTAGRDRFREYVDMADTSGGLFFSLGGLKTVCWTKTEVVNHLRVTAEELFVDQIQAALFLIRNGAAARQFIADWLALCRTDSYRLLDDRLDPALQRPEFIENRHDQALLSILARRSAFTIILGENDHNTRSCAPGSPLYLLPFHNTRGPRVRRIFRTSRLPLNYLRRRNRDALAAKSGTGAKP
jgi:hypothetical protein